MRNIHFVSFQENCLVPCIEKINIKIPKIKIIGVNSISEIGTKYSPNEIECRVFDEVGPFPGE